MIRGLVEDQATLAVRANEVDIKDHDRVDCIIQDLTDTINNLDVLYLTANQIGLNERAFAMKFNDGVKVFINPAIQKRDKMILFREKDYLTKDEYIVPRFTEISLVYQEKDEKKLEYGLIKGLKFNEGASIIVCQAIDALNGLFDSDYGLPILEGFDEASEEEKEELLAAYAESLKNSYKELDEDLSNDDNVKERWGAAKFITHIARGDIEKDVPELSNRKKKKLKKFLKQFTRKVK